MEYSGLITQYPINRPLTEEEKSHRLDPRKRLDYSPHYNLSTIKINSTFLEIVDKFYAWKGSISWLALIIVILLTVFYAAVASLAISRWDNPQYNDGVVLVVLSLLTFPFLAGMFWLLFREFDTYTHYPIRLNRKNRMVYVFRRDGTVLRAPWDALFVTFGRGGYDYVLRAVQWTLRAHVLDSDGVTVRETFDFPTYGIKQEELLNYWEFVRRYMEDGPGKLIGHEIGQVEICHPIADRKESFGWSMQLIYSHFAPVPILFWLMSPFLTLVGLSRYLANLTCEVPVWPKSVEDACPIAPDDPYARDHRNNPPSLLKLVKS